MPSRFRSFTGAFVAMLAIAVSPVRADITLSDTPLFLSAGVTPNLMLLFDNSGSMNNIIWDDGFDPSVTYPNWANYQCDRGGGSGNSNRNPCWSTSGDGNVRLEELYDDRDDCNSFTNNGRRIRGRNGNRTRCLVLPDPVGDGATRYDGNYLNYLFATYANTTGNNGRNLIGLIPQETRLSAAKDVSRGLIDDNDDLRWGLARFNPPTNSNSGPGGRVIANCGADLDDLQDEIDDLSANSNTPLAETYYEISRYFRGLDSSYNSGVSYTSPIQYRCQKSFVVVVTDGFPTYDNSIPNDDPADLADPARALPNWDNRSPATATADYPIFPQYSDGFAPSGDESDEGYRLYLDDVAKFAYDIDARPTGNDLTGVSFNDASFATQRVQTFTVGLALNNQMLRDAAVYGDGKAYTANNAAQLRASLQDAINQIAAVTSAAASVATNSTRLTIDTAIYQARFATGDWSGQLLALPVSLDGSVDAPLWDAAEVMPAFGSRVLLTYDPSAANNRGRRFEWNQLNGSQKAALNRNRAGTVDGNGQARLAWLRGDRSNEGDAGLGFRARSAVLGDIVNSDPAFAGQQDFGFDALPGSEGSSYTAYRTSAAYRGRPATIYVGANDGMMHAFRASDGVELFGYVPAPVYGRLSALTDPLYNSNHEYYVDGSMRVLDAHIGGGWKTVLVGGLGGGGRGVFALDVSDPAGFVAQDVLWEFTNAQDSDMGHSYPQPTIARLNDGTWVAVVANGYNSDAGEAVLFLIDLADGSVVRKFETGVGGDNGLSSPIPVDTDDDRITDLIYAGDLKGNLWKFDLKSSNRSDWKIAYGTAGSPEPLFVACSGDPCTGANRQPITARPEVGRNDAAVTGHDGYVVYFGTGRYFAEGDNSNGGLTNTFYGIYDTDAVALSSGIDGRDDLLEQRVLATLTANFGGRTEDVRVTTDNVPDGAHRGWYLDLPASGERQVSTPILRGGSIIFTTLIPNTAACGFGGDSFLMEIDALTGSRRESTPFDLNRDTAFDDEDTVVIDGQRYVVSGRRSREGIIKTPAIIAAANFEVKLASGTTGGIDTTIEPPAGVTPGGRLSWRQMQ